MVPLFLMMKLRKLKIFKELDTSRECLIYQQIVLIFLVFLEMIADNNQVILDLSITLRNKTIKNFHKCPMTFFQSLISLNLWNNLNHQVWQLDLHHHSRKELKVTWSKITTLVPKWWIAKSQTDTIKKSWIWKWALKQEDHLLEMISD